MYKNGHKNYHFVVALVSGEALGKGYWSLGAPDERKKGDCHEHRVVGAHQQTGNQLDDAHSYTHTKATAQIRLRFAWKKVKQLDANWAENYL